MAQILSQEVVSDSELNLLTTIMTLSLLTSSSHSCSHSLQSATRNVKARAERPRSTAFGANRGFPHIVIHGQGQHVRSTVAKCAILCCRLP
jgi:hypothetical protein